MTGDDIKKGRRKRGLTQARLAVLLGINQATLSRWEKGQTTPSLRVRNQLAQLLGMPSGEFDRRLFLSVERDIQCSSLYDKDMRMLACSPSAAAAGGVTVEEALRVDWMKCLDKPGLATVEALHANGLFRGEADYAEGLGPIITPHGTHLLCQTQWVPFRLESGDWVARFSLSPLPEEAGKTIPNQLRIIKGQEETLLFPGA